MPQLFSQDQPKTFRCPNCGEIINTAMSECAFCRTLLTPESATATADFQEHFDKACSDARDLKIMALGLVAFFVVYWIPFIDKYTSVGFLVLAVLTPIMLGRWWVKYNGIQSSDGKYKLAQRNVLIASVIWGAICGLWLLVNAIEIFLAFRGDVTD